MMFDNSVEDSEAYEEKTPRGRATTRTAVTSMNMMSNNSQSLRVRPLSPDVFSNDDLPLTGSLDRNDRNKNFSPLDFLVT